MEENKDFNEINKLTEDLTDQNEIVQKLEKIKDNKNFLDELLLYYPILSPEKCKNYNINKTKTEKKLFYEIILDLINKFFYIKQYDENKSIEEKLKEMREERKKINEYIVNLLKAPATEELKNLKLEKIPSRWNNIYKRIIRFEEEKNEELIYYNFSNNFLNNIKKYKNPFDIIIVLNEFKTIIGNFENIDKLSIKQKKFILFGLCNTEYLGVKNNAKTFIEQLRKMEQKYLEDENKFNSQICFDGLLNKIIVNYCCSKLAKDAFKNLFGELPKEIKNEIFTEKILNYIYYLPFNALENIERTDRRFSLILINQLKDSIIIKIKNPNLKTDLKTFVNITIRKFTFQHEHQHFSGGLLFFIGKSERINTPKQKYENNKLTILKDNYLINEDEKKKLEEKSIIISQERGELYEQMYYGKIFSKFKMIELLFIANEDNNNLNREEHLEKFNQFTKNIKLEEAFKNFPKNQILSKLINDIFFLLLVDKEENGDENLLNLLETEAIARRIGAKGDNENILKILNNNVIAEKGKCYLSGDKPDYKFLKRKDK